MKFTIVLPSNEASDLSVGCLFIPCLVWTLNRRTINGPHRATPDYLHGDFQRLLEHPKIRGKIASHSRDVVVVVHPIGNGTEGILEKLLSDVNEAGFNPVVVRLSEPQI